MKKFVLLVVLIIGITLTGCKNGKILGGSDGKTILTYYVWGNNNEIKAIQDIIEAFEEENPDITVQLERAGDDYFGDLKLKFASRNAPDIFLMDPGEIRPFLEEDFIEPLDDYIARSENISLDDLWSVNDGYRYNGKDMGKGKLYAFIKDWSPDFMLIYNKTQVEEYRENNPGAFPYLKEDEPMTWTEFLEFSQAMTIGSGTNIKRQGTTMDFVPFKHLFEWIQMSNTSMFTSDGTKFNRNDENVKKAFKFFIDLQEGANAPAPYNGSSSLAVGGERFKLGDVSSVFLGRWAFVAYDWHSADFEIGIAPPPVPDNMPVVDGKRQAYAGVSGMIANCINADSKNKKEAYKFVEYYMTKGMEEQAKLGFNIPGNKTIALDAFQNVEDEEIRKINEIFLNAATKYSYPIEYNKYVSTTRIERILSANFSLYFEKKEGITSIDALLDKVSEEINKEISNARRY